MLRGPLATLNIVIYLAQIYNFGIQKIVPQGSRGPVFGSFCGPVFGSISAGPKRGLGKSPVENHDQRENGPKNGPAIWTQKRARNLVSLEVQKLDQGKQFLGPKDEQNQFQKVIKI
jgi:hypothetical protein